MRDEEGGGQIVRLTCRSNRSIFSLSCPSLCFVEACGSSGVVTSWPPPPPPPPPPKTKGRRQQGREDRWGFRRPAAYLEPIYEVSQREQRCLQLLDRVALWAPRSAPARKWSGGGGGGGARGGPWGGRGRGGGGLTCSQSCMVFEETTFGLAREFGLLPSLLMAARSFCPWGPASVP